MSHFWFYANSQTAVPEFHG